MARLDELRMMVRVVRLYYGKGWSQPQIARALGMSQATISRLLSRAKDDGIVRISISTPNGVYTQLEEQLIDRFGLRDAVVMDTLSKDDEKVIIYELGTAAAYYVESIIQQNEIIGLSSWSSTLLALANAMHPITGKSGIKVVQILGGAGQPTAEAYAHRLSSRIANLVGGTVVSLPAPGIVGSAETLRDLVEDIYVQQAFELFDKVTLALVGIGSLQPSDLLAQSGNIFSHSELSLLSENGAVGDILLHFFDRDGCPIETFLDNRVMSMTIDQLRRVDKAIGVAGGQGKWEAILGVLRGRLINILITDRYTAEYLMRT